MKKIRVAINGFGRIGRTLGRLLLNDPAIEWVAVNDIHSADALAHLFKYDSVHGVFKGVIKPKDGHILINDQEIQFLNEKDPAALPWAALKIDIVVECSGKFKDRSTLQKHIDAGANKVILAVPPDGDDIKTIVLGINTDLLEESDTIISNASCTTNSAAPLIKIIDDLCGIESCYITTVHSYTMDQSVHDSPHKDYRRARAASQSIIPTTTGAAKAITKIFPHLDNLIGGCGIRVPVPDGSLTDITFIVKETKSIEEINEHFEQASTTNMKGILEYTEDPIVSVDVINNPHSCIFDSLLTSVIGRMVKVVGWYDNESGYSNRLLDLVKIVGK
jgi:glyceraldehyde 3-phosphate dehydrogenase